MQLRKSSGKIARSFLILLTMVFFATLPPNASAGCEGTLDIEESFELDILERKRYAVELGPACQVVYNFTCNASSARIQTLVYYGDWEAVYYTDGGSASGAGAYVPKVPGEDEVINYSSYSIEFYNIGETNNTLVSVIIFKENQSISIGPDVIFWVMIISGAAIIALISSIYRRHKWNQGKDWF